MNTTIIKTNNEIFTDYPLTLGSYIVKCNNDYLLSGFILEANKSIKVLSGDAYIIQPSGEQVKEVIVPSSSHVNLKVQFKKDSIIKVTDNYYNDRVLVFRDDILAAGEYSIIPYNKSIDMLEDTSLSFLKGKRYRQCWFQDYPYPLDIENIIFTNQGMISRNVFGNLDNFLNKVAEIKKSGTLTITIYNSTLTYNNTQQTLNGKKQFQFTEDGWTEITT